jgi:hypothetical protein
MFFTNPLERAVYLAQLRNREAVDKLLKFEQRDWQGRIPAQVEAVAATRRQLAKAWDAYKNSLCEERNDHTD